MNALIDSSSFSKTPKTDEIFRKWKAGETDWSYPHSSFRADVAALETENATLRAALEAIRDSWPAHGSNTQNAMADAMASKARAALA